MIGAIALKGIVASINLLGATDGLTFEAFVIQNLYHHFGKGLVWFGIITTIHKGEEIELAIRKAGARLINLPHILLILIQLKAFGRNSRTLFVLSVRELI